MAIIRLVPSEYAVSSTSYLSVSNAENMYTNTDSTTYATITNTNTSTSSRFLYLRGFNFNDIPAGATINSFTVKIKGHEQGLATNTSYAPRLANGTSAFSGTTASENFGTSTSTITIPTGSLTWQQISSTYGSSFTILVYVRRNNRNTTGYFYCYGAEIEVDCTLPNPRTITSTLNGNGSINPSGAQTYYDGQEYHLTITPTDLSDPVTATKNGVDITSDLVPPSSGTITEEKTLGAYTLVSGSFNSGSDWFSGRVGKGYDTTDKTTSNYYSSGSSTIVVFTYDMPVNVPEGSNITACYLMVNGHAESTSNSSEYMCAQLYAGSTAISNELNFKSVGTSNSTQTIQATTLPTVAQCSTLKMRCRLGYYGGAINGATLFLTYSYQNNFYTYSYTVNGDATIVVTIGTPTGPTMYMKSNGTWSQVSKVYLKVNGSWVDQASSTWSSIFSTSANYVKGN